MESKAADVIFIANLLATWAHEGFTSYTDRQE